MMDPLSGAAAALGLLVIATLLGFWMRKRTTKIRHHDNPETLSASDFDLERFGPSGAVVQLSTQFCSRCPGVRRELTALTNRHASLQLRHLDVTSKPDLATKYRLRQTPTVLIINADGVLQSRLSGALTREQLSAAVNELTGGTP